MKPTCWYHPVSGRVRFDGDSLGASWIPLYKHMPWQSLTDQEFHEIVDKAEGAIAFYHLVDQKLKEKNAPSE